MIQVLPSPPNFTLSPPPRPPGLAYDFSCANGEVLLHVDFGGLSTASSNQNTLKDDATSSRTVSILGILIGILALILTGLITFLYIYKKKVIKDEVAHHETKLVEKSTDVLRSSDDSNGSTEETSQSKPAGDFQPYCNVIYPARKDSNFDKDHSPCCPPTGRASTTTSGVSSESFENLQNTPLQDPPMNCEKQQPHSHKVANGYTWNKNAASSDDMGREYVERFLTLQNQRKHEANGRRRKKRRSSVQHPYDRNGTSCLQHYGTMESSCSYNPKLHYYDVNEVNTRADFQPRASLGYPDGMEFRYALAADEFQNTALTVVPYRQTRRAPRMGLRSMGSSSLFGEPSNRQPYDY